MKDSTATGPLSLSSALKFTDILTPQSFPDTINSLGETEAGMKLGIVVAGINVGNETGNTCSAGWGYRSEDVLIYSFDGSDLDALTPLVDGDVVEADAALLVSAPFPFHGLKVEFGADSNSNVVCKYWNGTAFTAFPALADYSPLLAADNTTSELVAPKRAPDWAAVDGRYLASFEVDANVTISDVEAINLLDYVDNVASGNALTKEFGGDGGYIVAGHKLVAFVSEANANNWATVDYRQK